MRIEERVPIEIKRKLGYNNDSRRKKKKRHYKHREELSEHEIKRLMGQYDPVYRRGKGGALRQR